MLWRMSRQVIYCSGDVGFIRLEMTSHQAMLKSVDISTAPCSFNVLSHVLVFHFSSVVPSKNN